MIEHNTYGMGINVLIVITSSKSKYNKTGQEQVTTESYDCKKNH